MCAESLAIWPIDEDPLSESYRIARYFQDKGWHLYPIHDQVERILEENCYRDIRLIPGDYDVLLLFVYPDRLPEVVNAIFNAAYRPPLVWAHTGIHDQESFDRLTDSGVLTVMDHDLMEFHKYWLEK
jgi:predicted CoA-binding protein